MVGRPEGNAASWTSAELLADVRQKARIPAGTIDYTDAVLLNEASRAIWSFAGWAMSKAADGRLLSQLQRASSGFYSSTYATGRDFDLPYDAVGDTFDSVFWLDTASNTESRLDLVDIASQPLYDTPIAQGLPWGYAIVGGRLRVYGKPQSAGSVRVNYQRRLPKLVGAVSGDTYANITNCVNTTTDFTVTHTIVAPVFASGDRFDVMQSSYPYRYYIENAQVANATATTVQSFTYTNATLPLATNTLAGQTLVLCGESPYVHLPLEFKQCLTQKIAAQILGDIGDAQGSMMLEQKAEAELARVVAIINPRSQSTRVKVVNPYSHLRSGRMRGMR